jgi:hypothetical protein
MPCNQKNQKTVVKAEEGEEEEENKDKNTGGFITVR